MSIEDRDWYRKDSEQRRKQIEMDEKEDLRRKRQIGADAMWNEIEPSRKASYNKSGYYTVMPNKKRQKSPFWMRMIQVLGAVAVAAVVLFMVANSELGSRFLQQNKNQLPSIQLPSATEKAAEQRAEARSNPTSNTAVIPSNLVYDNSTQEEFDHFAKEYGLTAVEKGEDGSLTLSSDSKIMHANVDALVAVLSKKCGEPGYKHFSSISVNEGHTAFIIVVNDMSMSAEEKQVVTDLFLMAGLEAVQTGQKVQNLRVETMNTFGGIINAMDTNPDINAPLQAAHAGVTTKSASQSIYISSSRIVKEPSYEGTCPFRVILPIGDEDYYIYLKYLEPSEQSITNRDAISNDSVDDVAIYIKANDEDFTCKIPVGVYQLFYTFGDTWFGPDERFGKGAPMYKSDHLIEFYNDGKTLMGHTVKLQPVRNGNLETTPVLGIEFPS